MSKKVSNKSPRVSAGLFARLFFTWLYPVLKEGSKKTLEYEDIYDPLPEDRSKYLGDQLAIEWEKELRKCSKAADDNSQSESVLINECEEDESRVLHETSTNNDEGDKSCSRYRPSLVRAILRIFGLRFALVGVFLFIEECVVKIAQSFCLGLLLRYFAGEFDETHGLLYATGVILCSMYYNTSHHPCFYFNAHLNMKIRIACSSLVFRKAMNLSQFALTQTTVGQLVNILSNDVARLDTATTFLHYLWIGPIQLGIVVAILWSYFDVACLSGICFLILFTPFQSFMGHLFSSFRQKVVIKTDRRIRIMNEILNGIRVIKMYAWEIPFSKLVDESRTDEIKTVEMTMMLRAANLSLCYVFSKLIIFLTLVTYVLTGNFLTAEKVFVAMSLYQNVRVLMTIFFPLGISSLADIMVSIRRIEALLLLDDYKPQSKEKSSFDKAGPRIYLQNVTAKWTSETNPPTLSTINLQAKKGELIAVIGSVGSGKSSLLHVILQELPVSSGKAKVSGSCAYVSQDSWVFTGSVRDNILFGKPYIPSWYQRVIKACALDKDFEMLPHGDKSMVGDKGRSLSGGQRARISLARAVYANSDIYLLDDPLSAVDAEIGRHLFEKCITGILRNKLCILVTHQLQYLPSSSLILALKNGQIMAQGDYSFFQQVNINLEKLLSESKPGESRLHRDENASGVSLDKFGLEARASEDITNSGGGSGERLGEFDEKIATGGISLSIPWKYIRSGSNIFTILFFLASNLLTQAFYSGCDYWLQFWIKQEQAIQSETPTNNWLSYLWNKLFPTLQLSQRSQQLYFYTFLVSMLFIMTCIRTVGFFKMCMRSSVALHRQLFRGILRAPMLFFEQNPIGRILNRFSKDIGTIDELLPFTLFDTVEVGLQVVGVIVVISAVDPLFLLPSLCVALLLILTRKYFQKTSRNLQRLESSARSPVFCHLSSSLSGLTTIRAFKVQKDIQRAFESHLDLHSSVYFLFMSSVRWLAVVIDWISISYIIVVIYGVLFLQHDGPAAGLAISSAMALTCFFQWGVRQSCESENQMVSVERVLEYTNIEAESSLESSPDRKPPDHWPSEGAIEVNNLCLSYTKDGPNFLKNITFSIFPLEKIGIVGRTGAGKTSLISVLFRLTEPSSGTIIIDGINVLDIGLHDLRSKIAIIPQEPVLFLGTIRNNLDPFEDHKDCEILEALRDVHLYDLVASLPGGLDTVVTEGGSNFSVGQRQLICMGRAILRKNKILIMDEPTANVDSETDILIQKTVRTKFTGCTVLTVAHRLSTVIDCDRIIVMNEGAIQEFDKPIKLLHNTSGGLYKLVQESGPEIASRLMALAAEKCEN